MGLFDSFTNRQRATTHLGFDHGGRSISIASSYNPPTSADVIITEFLCYTWATLSMNPVLGHLTARALSEVFNLAAETFLKPETHERERNQVLPQECGWKYRSSGHALQSATKQCMEIDLKLTYAFPRITLSPVTLDNPVFVASSLGFVEHTVRALHHFVDTNPRTSGMRGALVQQFQAVGKAYIAQCLADIPSGATSVLSLGHFMRSARVYYYPGKNC
jgi:hypothetical protein